MNQDTFNFCSGGVETVRHARVESVDGDQPLSSRGSCAPPTANNLPVPVLAEPDTISREDADIPRSGPVCGGSEAREKHQVQGGTSQCDSRGGQNSLDITQNFHKGAETSVAANPATPIKQRQQNAILTALRASNGLICQQLEDRLGLAHESCSARVSEMLRDGRIEVVGHGVTRSGNKARLYRVKELWEKKIHHTK